MTSAIFYHAGCPVCVEAEQSLAQALDPKLYQLEVVHLGEASNQLETAKAKGVVSVPALVLNGHVFHINFGAKISDLE